MIDEFAVATLVRPLPEDGPMAGALGTVMLVHEAAAGHGGVGHTVAFMSPDGETLAIPTPDAADVRLATTDEIARWRMVQAAQ